MGKLVGSGQGPKETFAYRGQCSCYSANHHELFVGHDSDSQQHTIGIQEDLESVPSESSVSVTACLPGEVRGLRLLRLIRHVYRQESGVYM